MRRNPQNQRGAALITVLFITVVMTSLSVALLGDVTRGVSRAAGRSQTNQALWFAIGAEKLAVAVLDATRRQSPSRHTLNQPWATEEGRFDLGAGFIDADLVDASNCFNVNSLMQTGTTGLEVNEDRVEAFKALLRAIELPADAQDRLVDTLVDWMDGDAIPRDFGAEDFDYLDRAMPYRTSSDLLVDITTLRALDGMTGDIYGAVLPYVCARPTLEPSVININTLAPQHAPLLTMLTEGRMDVDTAEAVIALRPDTGYTNKADFLALPQFQQAGLATGAEAQIDVKSRYFQLNSTVAFGDSFVQLESLFDVQADGGIRRIARRMGDAE